MSQQFLHGVEVIEIDAGPRPIRTARSSVIGIVGTAPDADAEAFPLNTPVLIAGSRAEAALLDTEGDGLGTLPAALDGILDQAGAAVVVVRVDVGATEADTIANVIGGVNSGTGQFEGVQALLGAESVLGVSPRLLCAPGFTHQRFNGVLTITIATAGTGYEVGDAITATGGGGTGFAATVSTVSEAGAITAVTITSNGAGYTSAPTLAVTSDEGTSAVLTATVGALANPVVSEMVGIANRLRAIIIADGPNTTDAAAIAYAGDFGSARVYMVDPWVMVARDGVFVAEPASARVAGMIALSDQERGFWWSPSNREIFGISGTARPVDFKLSDPNSRANLLNEQNVTTIIRQNGLRLWGNRTLSSDPKFAFVSVRRTADILNDSLQRAHLWAVDRNITRTYVQDVEESVNAYIRSLIAQGALLGGRCWADPDLNTPANIAQGKVYFNFDFTPPYPAEHITFRSQLVNDYIEEALS